MAKIHSKLAERSTSKENFVHHSGFAKYHEAMKDPHRSPFAPKENPEHKSYVEKHGIASKHPEQHKMHTGIQRQVNALASGAPTENQEIALPTSGGTGERAL
jgi:predicted restriction endonuclease